MAETRVIIKDIPREVHTPKGVYHEYPGGRRIFARGGGMVQEIQERLAAPTYRSELLGKTFISREAMLKAELAARQEQERLARVESERLEIIRKRTIAGQIREAPPGVVSPYEPIEWKKAPIERATYEIGRLRERIYQRKKPGIAREAAGIPLGLAGAGLGIAAAVFHPIKTIKGAKELVVSPEARKELGISIGRTIRAEPGYATGYATGIYLGAKGFKPVGKVARAVTKKISPKYVPPTKVGIKFGKWTEIVAREKELALAGKRAVVTQVSPKPWFKVFRKEAVVRAAKPSELKYPRKVAGEVYTYWQPAVKGKPKALLGFGGVEPAAETGLIYALRHPTKVKWTIFGKPTAEIKVIKAKIKPLPKKIMRMKPSLPAEKVAAKYIMKRPGEFYVPAEVKRITRPLERAGLQEYQVALAPGTRLKAISKRWTEIYGQKVKLVKAEIKPPVKPIAKPKIPTARELALERIGRPLKAEPYYYKPTVYYPVTKIAKVGLVPSYKPLKYKPTEYYPTYPYKPTKYVAPYPYEPTKYIRYPAPYYPKAPYYAPTYYGMPKVPPYKAPYYAAPSFVAPPAFPKEIVVLPWAKRAKAPRVFRPIPQPQRYVPSLPATILRITARRKPYVVPKEFKFGFLPGIRPIVRGRKRKKK